MASKPKPGTVKRAPQASRAEPKQRTKAEKRRTVLQLPEACPKCGSHKLPAIGGVKPFTREIAGEMKGVKYSGVKWQDAACTECGQHVKLRVFLE